MKKVSELAFPQSLATDKEGGMYCGCEKSWKFGGMSKRFFAASMALGCLGTVFNDIRDESRIAQIAWAISGELEKCEERENDDE